MARNILLENRDKVESIAKALLKFETITGEEINALIRGESIDRPGVADLLDAAGPGPGKVGVARPVQLDPQPQAGVGQGPLPQPS